MVGNLVAKVASRCRAEPGDLHNAPRMARRSADARICRIEGVAGPNIYALACVSPTRGSDRQLTCAVWIESRAKTPIPSFGVGPVTMDGRRAGFSLWAGWAVLVGVPGLWYGRGGACSGHRGWQPSWFPGHADEFHRPGRTGAPGRGPCGGVPAGDGDRAGWVGQDPAGRPGGAAGSRPVRGRGVAGRAGARAGPGAGRADGGRGTGHTGAAGRAGGGGAGAGAGRAAAAAGAG